MNRELIVKGGMLVGAIALAFAAISMQETAHPAEEGHDWLEEQGYTEITGGETTSYFNACGKNVMSRTYEVTTEDGSRADRTVCFGIFGKHAPLFGG